MIFFPPCSSYGEEPSRANIHYNSLKFILDGIYTQNFSDNVALTPSETEGGAKTNLRAMVGLLLPKKKSKTDFKLFGNLVLNSGEHTIYDVKSFSLLLAEKLSIGQYIELLANGSLTRALSFNPISDKLPVDILSGKVSCATAIKSKKRISFVTAYTFTNEENYSGDDYRENTTLNTIWFNFTSKTALLVCYNFSQGQYISNIPANENTTYSHYGRAGIRFAKIFKRLDGQIGFGARHSRSTLYSTPDTESDGPAFNFRFGNSPVFADIEGKLNASFPKIKLGLNVDCGIRPTFGTNRIYAYTESAPDPTESLVYLANPFVSILGSRFSGSWNVVSNFFITVSLAGETRNFPVGSRQDTYIKQMYTMDWNIKKYFKFTVYYRRTNNNSNVDRYNYILNEFGLNLSAKL